WRFWKRIWWSKAQRVEWAKARQCRAHLDGCALEGGYASLGPPNELRSLPIHLRRQPFHRAGDVAPLREPAARKAEGEIGVLDAALAQAHAGRGRVARAARSQRRTG